MAYMIMTYRPQRAKMMVPINGLLHHTLIHVLWYMYDLMQNNTQIKYIHKRWIWKNHQFSMVTFLIAHKTQFKHRCLCLFFLNIHIYNINKVLKIVHWAPDIFFRVLSPHWKEQYPSSPPVFGVDPRLGHTLTQWQSLHCPECSSQGVLPRSAWRGCLVGGLSPHLVWCDCGSNWIFPLSFSLTNQYSNVVRQEGCCWSGAAIYKSRYKWSGGHRTTTVEQFVQSHQLLWPIGWIC